ncbi:AMP-binding protein [Nocardioides speluncae]|uniref:AMP-binding protein n=1 Tax=Nocardioides speluncae TaxID=2670337 RepID=UPI000D68A6D5|nr:AMP-binding protein [Nocardioides speluncae]
MTAVLTESSLDPIALWRRRRSATALVTPDAQVSFAELADRVEARLAELGGTRRLVLVGGANEVEPLVTYLAAIAGRHPVLLTAGDAPETTAALVERYRPDVVHRGDAGEWRLEEHADGTTHDLHPDLAVLLSTSGSTGSPKLVRLSHENVHSNAAAIAAYLRIGEDDRAATTLPMHYCYGLSVVNSHLLTGAGLMLTERSVVEEEFWAEFAAAGATSFAGVPYTFDLLDASGFADRELPTLRTVTQAGGRLAPDRVRRYAELGERRDFELVVMYGATEATARMAYLPPELARTRPECIGVAIPGGELRIDPAGELVYAGPNVMLGYAAAPADLARGREVIELRTGDLARQHDDGLFEIVGRSSRFAKVFGLRLDLDRTEQLLAERGITARAVCHDDNLFVFCRNGRHQAKAREAAARVCGIPAHAVRTAVVAEFPVTPTGKPDHAALVRHATELDRPTVLNREDLTPDDVRLLYARLLGRPDATAEDSFASLGGDSLSFVEVSLQLGDALGTLPPDWPHLSATALAGRARPSARGRASGMVSRLLGRLVAVETAAVLRTVAIVLIVASHVDLINVMGGAHVLLGIAGYNLARFQLGGQDRRERVAGLLRSARELVVPTVVWVAGVAIVTGKYHLGTVLLVNNLVGARHWNTQWHFWFLEALLWTSLALAAAVAVPAVHRVEQRHPFGFALGLLALLSLPRFALAGITAGPVERYAVLGAAWVLALGWLIARASTTSQRVVASVAVVVLFAGFFGDLQREALVMAGLMALVWIGQVRLPWSVAQVVAVVGGATLFVYLTHWVVYPPLENRGHPVLAIVASFAVGIAACRAYSTLRRRVHGRQSSFAS